VSATDLWPLAALFAVGVVAGVLNVVAAGGSFITLPVLIFLGLPAGEANGTNRVGVLAQNLVGVWGFHRSRMMRWSWGLAVSVPAMIGSVLGTWLALQMTDFAFRRLLAVAMLAMTLWTVATPSSPGGRETETSPWHPGVMLAFFAIGVYGGLVQAGIGFAVLAVTSLAGMDLVKGNGVKLLSVLLVTALSLALFASGGAVQWSFGLALGAGNVLGALAGVRLAVTHGHQWLQRVVTAAVLLFAILLWFDY
jgi:uncharacterized protein